MPDQNLTEMLDLLRQSAQSTAIHTWHAKETAHADLLREITGSDARLSDPKRLYRAYSQVYSQHCEDGYLAEIFSRIGLNSSTIIEIGVGNGLENTTRFLLEQGWTGVWIEGNPDHVSEIRHLFREFIEQGSLKVIELLATAENINAALDHINAPDSFDLISIDVDFNTSHIWRALNRTGRVCCIEYNGSIPPSAAVEVPYDPNGAWDGTNFFGAGLKVIEQIGRLKGMALVGCELQGVNAYLVSSDETGDHFSAPFTAENHYETPKYSLLAHIGHPPSPCARRWAVSRGG